MRLRTERPLCLERVEELICQAIGPMTVVKYQDAQGQLQVLTDEALLQLGAACGEQSPALVRLHVYGACLPGALPPRPCSSPPGGAEPPAPADSTEEAPTTKESRRRQRQQARRQRRRERRAQRPQEPEAAAACEAAERPGMEDTGSEDEAAGVRACDVWDGMELWVESGTTKQFLQASGDGHVDFNGELEDAAAFTVRLPCAGANETAMALQGPGGRYLRWSDCGDVECTGAGPGDPDCRFSFVDVVEGVVLFLGPPGTGHVRAAPGAAAPRLAREAAPQGFRLLPAPPRGPAG